MDMERLQKLASEGDGEAQERLDLLRLRKGEVEVTVEYNGRFPNACSGTLTIKIGDRVIYSDKYVCSSSGSVWFDEDWSEHVESGKLTWTEVDGYPPWIQNRVQEVLDEVSVCCGGCV